MNLPRQKGNTVADEPFDFSEIKFPDENGPLEDPSPKTTTSKARPKTGTKPRTAGRPTKSNVIAELQEDIEGFLTILAMPAYMRDRHPDGTSCADLVISLDENGFKITTEAKQLASAIATIGVDNKYIKKFFSAGDDLGKYLLLIQAMQPFIITVYGNHFAGRNEHARESFVEGA